ncbi:probable steroid-binding protein 3 isoform X2 [Vicia villosa]|uniref:probable steroid-binding protein 3 isoform X2 n=1 Tax=Vicia villosa TaxID=3911 RepID=UPI00273ACCCD|nr:probable steroid-binding protein 3 isoform X2 [Vicia villosa]
MEFYTTITNQISFYTGLSPTAFFTISFLTFFVYRTVTSMFVSPQDFNKPPVVSARSGSLFEVAEPRREPVQVGEITETELRLYNGSDKSQPILISVRGQIYDVSDGRNFYGPGGSYTMFAGRECSRALALLSFKPRDINGNLEGLDESELTILEDWEYKFMEKYPKVGRLVLEERIQQIEQSQEDNLKLSHNE